MPKPKFYLTTPIYYVNARPHIGHTYTTIVADTIARFKRMRGFDAVLLTGTDEHGQKVEQSARAAGKGPQEFADEVAADYRQLWQTLGLDYDRFLRTTEPRHAKAVQTIFQAVEKAGYIHKGKYEGQYCVFDELYVTDATPEGNCPECGRPTQRVEEENYFFQLSAFQDKLLAHYEKHPEFIRPESRRNEVRSFVRGGLRDLSISRSRLRWGIPLPGREGHVFYVWFDALTSYMSGIGYGAEGAAAEEYRRLWPADLHLVGKEIVRFHAVYWPAFLMAAGLDLPKMIFAHGWWVFEQQKMSKSRGNIVRPQPIHQVLGTDALRYFLLREMVFGQDSSFSYDALLTRYNSDLANGYGNLASRTLTMIGRYFNGEVPKPDERTKTDQQVAAAAEKTLGSFQQRFDDYDFSRGLEAVWTLIAALNKYLVETQPWVLAKDEKQRSRLETVLWTAAEGLRIVTALLAPVMPAATAQVWKQLGLTGNPAATKLDDLAWGQFPPATRIGKIEPVFPRLDKKQAIKKIQQLEAEEFAAQTAAAQPTARKGGSVAEVEQTRISIEDFAKVEMRVGEVKSAERVAGANKLLKLLVDIGSETRQIVAGIAETYSPEQLLGKKIVVVVNLQPRKLRGVESNGMLVAASVGADGRPVLATFAEDVEVGARLK